MQQLTAIISWLNQQKDLINLSIEHGFPEEGVDIANEALTKLSSAKDLAKEKGHEDAWNDYEAYFKFSLQKTQELAVKDDSAELDVSADWPVLDDKLSAEELKVQAEGLFRVELYDKALASLQKAYEKSTPNIKLVIDILECLTILKQTKEQGDFLAKALQEKEFNTEDQAQLYFYLGNIQLNLKKVLMARKSYNKVKELYPDLPGLDEKFKILSNPEPTSYTTPYSFLVEKGKMTDDQLSQGLGIARKERINAEKAFMDEYGISKDDMRDSLSAYYNVPSAAFNPDVFPPAQLFQKLKYDKEYLKKHSWVPFAQKGDTVEVLMNNPLDVHALNEIRFIYEKKKVVPLVVLMEDLEASIDDFFKKMSGSDLSTMELNVDVEAEIAEDVVEEEGIADENDSEIVRAVNAILVEAYQRGVSDIHIEPNPRKRFCCIRYRADGTCYEFQKIRIEMAKALISRIKIMSNLDIAERRLPQDGKIKLKLPEQNVIVEYRVSVYPVTEGYEDAVLRVLASGKPIALEELGMSTENFNRFESVLHTPYGLILVVGPTGSGKTTTLHSGLSYINTPERKILTAEDPVEITQEGMRQLQVKPKIGLSFAAALRSFLRSDPDVIMIGEMRDEETAQIGVECSLTGHLVFSTLHTNSAAETVSRLLDMGLDSFNFADSLKCVLAQRLMKTLCPKCKEPYNPSKSEFEETVSEFGPLWEERVKLSHSKEITFYRAKGCPDCVSGYKGRIGVHELLVVSEGLKTLIKYRKPTEEIRDLAIREGMLTLKQDGILKVIQGVSDLKQVHATAGH